MAEPAAVLLGVLEQQIVLTKRSAELRSFSGHVCLPGGRQDSCDTDVVATALREFREEIYFEGDIYPHFCMLPEQSIVSGQVVYPVVARLAGRIVGVNSAEVAKLILLPLAELSPALFQLNPDYPRIVHNQYFMFAEERVWGLTAHILQAYAQHYQSFFRE